MQFRWSRAKAILGIQPMLGLVVAAMWLTIMLVVPDSEPEPWHPNGRVHRRSSPRQQASIPPLGQHVSSAYDFSGTHGADLPHEGVYEPTSLASEETYEAELAVPRDYAQRLFGEAYGFLSSMEDRYGVSAATGSVGSSGGYSAENEMLVTLRVKGARRSVEYFRAKLRTSAHSAEMTRIETKVHHENGESVALSVPNDILVLFLADGGTRREDFERRTGAKIEISEEPDPEDPTAGLVTIVGETYDDAAMRDRGLFCLMKELSRAFDAFTPGVWQTVSVRIDPEKVKFVLGEDGSIIDDLVHRTGCRIQFGSIQRGSYPARQKVRITGPGDAPNEAKREIRRLIKQGEATMMSR